MGDSQGGIRSGSGRNPVGNDLRHKNIGNCGTVVGAAANFNVCSREMGYEGRGNMRDAWCHQKASETQLMATLEEFLREARSRQ